MAILVNPEDLLIFLAKFIVMNFSFFTIVLYLSHLYNWYSKPKIFRLYRKSKVIIPKLLKKTRMFWYTQYFTVYRILLLAYFMTCRMVSLMSSPKVVLCVHIPVLNYLTCYFALGFCLTGYIIALKDVAILNRHWLLKIELTLVD